MSEMMAVSAPDRSLQQRMDALLRANRIRSYRAQVKRDLKWGRRYARDVLVSDDQQLASMKVFELLLAMPKVGRVKAQKWLAVTRISPSKTLGGLTSRQRDELAALIGRGYAPRRVR